MMNDWLNTLSTVTNEKLRETLYSIEQFRADALGLALISGNSASANLGGGSGNEGNKGG